MCIAATTPFERAIAQRSVEQMHAKLVALCAQQIPGDTYRNLAIAPEYSGRTFKHILVPIWLLTYTYGARAFQVLANGYSGKIAGRYPISPWKVLFAILVIAIVVITIIAIANN